MRDYLYVCRFIGRRAACHDFFNTSLVVNIEVTKERERA